MNIANKASLFPISLNGAPVKEKGCFAIETFGTWAFEEAFTSPTTLLKFLKAVIDVISLEHSVLRRRKRLNIISTIVSWLYTTGVYF